MSKKLPVYVYPGGNQIPVPTENTTYKWIDSLGGAILPGPLYFGAKRPDGIPGHGGVATTNNGHTVIEYHGMSSYNGAGGLRIINC